MIDWLEEVLRGAQSGEEQNRLLELLRQTGMALSAGEAFSGEEEQPPQGEETQDAPLTDVLQSLLAGAEGSPQSPAQMERGTGGSIAVRRTAMEDSPVPAEIFRPEEPLNFAAERDREIPPELFSAESGLQAERGTALSGGEERSLLAPVVEAVDSAALMTLARRAMEQMPLERRGISPDGPYMGKEPVGYPESSPLHSLYRRAVEAVAGYPASGAAGAPVVIREEMPSAAGLTTRELDRAVRRDSRRYDGGMNIY